VAGTFVNGRLGYSLIFALDLMETGTIKRLTDRGFGFIEADSDEYDDDLFFHANEVEDVEFDVLTEGETMQFEVTETPKGMNAVSVTRHDGDDTDDTTDEAGEEPEADEGEDEAEEAPEPVV